MLESISILVCTRDRRDMLNALLADLGKQDYAGQYEIIVVEETDDPSPPAGVSYVPHPMLNKGIAFARNMAIEHATGDVVVFVDDDCRVSPDWLRRLVRPLEDAGVLGMQGGVTVPQETNAIGWAESVLGFPGGGVGRIHRARGQLQDTIEVSTLNAAYRRSVIAEVGGFPVAARFGGEDYLLAKCVAGRGRLVFVPDAVVRHVARGSVPAIWHWFERRGMAEFELWRSGMAPQDYGRWMIRSSLSIKLLPFVLLCWWSMLPLLAMIALIVVSNMWRERWVVGSPEIPLAAWFWLPWVRMLMAVGSDVGRVRAWLREGRDAR